MHVQNLVIVAPKLEMVHHLLQEMDIPARAFFRKNVVVSTCKRDIERIRGLGLAHWTEVPGHAVSMELRHILQAHCRGGHLPWALAVVRHLAWRHYHEC